ncbi:MAG: hypothetical protein ACXWQO_19455 [Bdellovibrionota bacterium]
MNFAAVVFLSSLLAVPAFAEEIAPNPPSPQMPAAPAAAEAPATIPNARELSPENYQLLGRLVWERVQKDPDRSKPDYSYDDLGKMIDDMRRNRNELTITLDDLMPLLESGCKIKNSVPGLQLDGVSKIFK